MKNTKNYNLQKPDLNNVADIEVLNSNFDKIDNGIAPFYVATLASANTYKITTGMNKTSLSDGYSIRVAIPTSSNGDVSLKVDNVTVAIKKPNGNAVTNFKANGVYNLNYYKSVFILASGSCDDVSFTSDKLLEGSTANNSDGEKVNGTMPERGYYNANIGINGSIDLPAGHYSGVHIGQALNYHEGGWTPTEYGVYSDYFYQHLDTAYYKNAETRLPIVTVARTLGFNENNVVGSVGGINGSALRYMSGTIPASQVTIINKIYALIDISSYVDFTPVSVWGMCGNYYFSICNINGQIKYINYYNASSSSEYRTNMSSIYGQTLNVKQIPVNSGSSGSGSGNSAKQYDTIWYAIG